MEKQTDGQFLFSVIQNLFLIWSVLKEINFVKDNIFYSWYHKTSFFVPTQGARTEHLSVSPTLRRGWLHHPPGFCLPYGWQHLAWPKSQKGAVLYNIRVWYFRSFECWYPFCFPYPSPAGKTPKIYHLWWCSTFKGICELNTGWIIMLSVISHSIKTMHSTPLTSDREFSLVTPQINICWSQYFGVHFSTSSPESSVAVPVLPGPGPNRHVPTEQQQPVPRVLQEPSARVSAKRPACVSVHRWPHAVPLHQGQNCNNEKRHFIFLVITIYC